MDFFCLFVSFFFFFKAVTKAVELSARRVKESAKILGYYLLCDLKIKQNATKYTLNLIWFAKYCLLFCQLKEFC